MGKKENTKICQCLAGVIDVGINVSQKRWEHCSINRGGIGLQALNSRNLHFVLHHSCWLPFPHWTSTTQTTHLKPIFETQPCNTLKSRGSPCCLPTGCVVWIEFLFSGMKKTRCNALLVFRRHIKTYELLIISFRMCVTGPWRKLLDKPAGHAKRQHWGFSARTWLLITLVGYFNWLIVKQFCSACSTC